MHRIRLIFTATLALALLATLFLYFHTRESIQSIALVTDYRGPDGPQTSFAGSQSWGLYLGDGRIGWLYRTQTAAGLSSEELPGFQPKPTRLLWKNSNDADGDTDTRPPSTSRLESSAVFSRTGILVINGYDAGMRHRSTVRGCLLDLWIIALFLAITIAANLWILDRGRRRLARGLCPNCEYDIRTQLLAHATPTCPECGTPIATSRKMKNAER